MRKTVFVKKCAKKSLKMQFWLIPAQEQNHAKLILCKIITSAKITYCAKVSPCKILTSAKNFPFAILCVVQFCKLVQV